MSLGATREFALCSISDSGQYHKQNLHIANLWSLSHGDLFALGPQTNQSFGHVVPQDKSVDKLRISIIFRTVIKSFIDLSPTVRNRRVKYANGTEKRFQAECVLSTSLSDAGTRTHLCDLIHQREERKKAQLLAKLRAQERNIQAKPVTTSLLDTEDPKKYFRGHGQHVPMVTNSDTSTTDTTVTTVTTTKSISNQRVSYDTFEGRPETTDINRPVFTLMKPNSSRVNSIRSPRAIYSRNHIQTDNTNKIKYYVSESDANERTSYLLDSCETVTTSRPQIHGKVEKPALLRWLQTSQRILE